MELQTDKSARVAFVDVFEDEILDRVSVHPCLNARPVRDDAQRVPSIVDEIMMAVVDLLLRRDPAGAESFAVQQTGRRKSWIEPPHFDLRPIHAAGGVLRSAAGAGNRPYARSNLNAL